MSHHPERTARNVRPVNQPPSFDFHVLIWRLIMVSIGYNGKYRNVALLDRLFRQSRKGGGKPLARSVRGRTCKNST